MSDTSMTIIGGGVVGLAVAARLARRFPDLVVVERRDRPGQETSSRNSEVVHAGLYYPPGSWKARLCVRGNALVRERALRRGVAFRRIGKLVVAVKRASVASLEALCARATENGARVERADGRAVACLEPAVPAVAGFLSPDTGIVSAHGLDGGLAAEAIAAGAVSLDPLRGRRSRATDERLARRRPNARPEWPVIRPSASSTRLVSMPTPWRLLRGSMWMRRATACTGGRGATSPRSPARSGLVSRLVYPVPEAVSLGTHAILGLDGRLRFGPDVEYLPQRRQDYGVDGAKRSAFGQAVGRLFRLSPRPTSRPTCRHQGQAPGSGRGVSRLRHCRRGLAGGCLGW